MTTVQIDCYGNQGVLGSSRFLHPSGERYPVLVDDQDTVTYLCFDRASAGPQPIHRITESGTVTEILWDYGEWANRASLTYDKTKNQPITITL